MPLDPMSQFRVAISQPHRWRSEEGLALPPTQEVQSFVDAAAGMGLTLAEAVRLGLERALLLAEATALGLDSEVARRKLCGDASKARPKLPLEGSEAKRLRSLIIPQPIAPPLITPQTVVPVPPRLFTRVRDRIPISDLRPAVVPEMITWEVAAILAAKTIEEWGLFVLAKN
jgi:hypothetical protein